MVPAPARPRPWLSALGLALLVAAAFLPALGNGFVDFDDDVYVYANDAVRAGLTLDGVAWAFTTTHASNWHPLTWLSHMVDVELFGLAPAAHHAVSVLLHAATSALLFLGLRVWTGRDGPSWLCAALFGLHPLRVESVAWASERKDVLSALLLVLTLAAYARYARQPGWRAGLVVLLAYALGLLAKPTLVTLPLALLLFDVWPLGRLPLRPGGAPFLARLRPLVVEKLPLLALSAASAALTWHAQSGAAAASRLNDFPLAARAANACLAPVAYLADTAWPGGLAFFYPHPASVGRTPGAWEVAGACALLVLLSASALAAAPRRTWLAVGWLWFLGTLVPVIGLVQVGAQARADRYTLVPHLGLSIALAFAAAELSERARLPRWARGGAAGALLLALAARTASQTSTWRDATTLYSHAIEVTRDNWLAWNNLGKQHFERGELGPAAAAFEAARRIKPDYDRPWYNLGLVHLERDELEAATRSLARASELAPGDADVWTDLGLAHLRAGRARAALECLTRALRLQPDHAPAWENAALAHAIAGDRQACQAALARLQALDPQRAASVRTLVEAMTR